MKLSEIKKHWMSLSKKFGTGLKATTKTPTIKALEIDALARAIASVGLSTKKEAAVLEAGCGNGQNCFALAELFPRFNITGADYLADMVENARRIKRAGKKKYSRTSFFQGDMLRPNDDVWAQGRYDLVFTDRCLINLNADRLQRRAVDALIRCTKPGGYLMLIENFMSSYGRQNDCRVAVGLPPRAPASYNLFIDERKLIPHIAKKMKHVSTEDFGSLHDILLYVLVPMVNRGVVDYDAPIVKAGAQLSMALAGKQRNTFGSFGQNRLYVFRKPGPR
jgi:SAM-dependent methyltransferase